MGNKANGWRRTKKVALIGLVCVALGAALLPSATSAWLSWDDQAKPSHGGGGKKAR